MKIELVKEYNTAIVKVNGEEVVLIHHGEKFNPDNERILHVQVQPEYGCKYKVNEVSTSGNRVYIQLRK